MSLGVCPKCDEQRLHDCAVPMYCDNCGWNDADDEAELGALEEQLAEAKRVIEWVSTRSVPDKDEANYPIYRWPNQKEINAKAREFLERKRE